MATKLFLRASENSGIGTPRYRDLSTTAGASAKVARVAVVSGDVVNSERQFFKNSTKTQLLTFVTQPLAAGFTLSGTMTFSVWGLEGSMNNNAGLRARVYKRTAAGVETEVGGGPWDDNVEMGTSFAEMTWTGTPTSTAFAAGDRIVVRIFTDIVGANASATADCQVQYNGADGAAGDSFFQITENVTFDANAALGTFFDEQFEGAGTEETWSLGTTVDGGATLDPDYAAGAGCSGSQSARHVVPAGAACRYHHDYGEKRTLYGRVQIYIESRTDPMNAFHPLLSIGTREDEGAPAVFLAHLVRRGSGNPIGLEVDMWHNGGVNQIPAAVPVLLNTRYQLEWKWDLVTATWQVWLNDVSLGSGSITGTGLNSVPSFISLGSGTFARADFPVTYQTDMVALSDSARIGYVDCPTEIAGDVAGAQAGQQNELAGDVVLKSTVAASQAPQTNALVGAPVLAGDAAGAQAPQTNALDGALVLAGDITGEQAPQTNALSGALVSAAAVAGEQDLQTNALVGKLLLEAVVDAAQPVQAGLLEGEQPEEGGTAVSGAQPQQEGTLLGAHPATADVSGSQPAQSGALNGRQISQQQPGGGLYWLPPLEEEEPEERTIYQTVVDGDQRRQRGQAQAHMVLRAATTAAQGSQGGAVHAAVATQGAVTGVQPGQGGGAEAQPRMGLGVAGVQAGQGGAVAARVRLPAAVAEGQAGASGGVEVHQRVAAVVEGAQVAQDGEVQGTARLAVAAQGAQSGQGGAVVAPAQQIVAAVAGGQEMQGGAVQVGLGVAGIMGGAQEAQGGAVVGRHVAAAPPLAPVAAPVPLLAAVGGSQLVQGGELVADIVDFGEEDDELLTLLLGVAA